MSQIGRPSLQVAFCVRDFRSRSDAFALAPSLEFAYVWHASKFTREVLDGVRQIAVHRTLTLSSVSCSRSDRFGRSEQVQEAAPPLNFHRFTDRKHGPGKLEVAHAQVRSDIDGFPFYDGLPRQLVSIRQLHKELLLENAFHRRYRN